MEKANVRPSRVSPSLPPSDGQPLISHISGRDPLPNGWKVWKRARYSTGDSSHLELYLEEQYGIIRPLQRTRSAPSAIPSSRPAEFGQLKTSSRQQWSYRREISRAFIDRFRSAQRTILPVPQRETLQQRPSVLAIPIRVLCECLRLVWDVLSWFFWYFGKLYRVFRKPLAIIVAALAIGALGLNLFATAYTVTHDSFLNTFCPKKLPIVRDMLCSDWDELQLHRAAGEFESGHINEPFTAYLQNGNRTLSYELPYYLSHIESIIRSFRATLPESEYSAIEQEEFREQFTAYIDHSSVTVVAAQHFYAHIMGTIQLHVSDTNWLVRKLNTTGFSSNVTLHINGPLAQSMEFLESHHMVYLIGGLEPFKKDVLQATTIEAAQIMKAHVGAMSERLMHDVRMIHALQSAIVDLAIISEVIQRHVSRCTSESKKESMDRYNNAWAHLTKHLSRSTFSDYQIEQREKWLNDMRPIFKGVTEFLYQVASEFETARLSCLQFEERLQLEGRAAKYGWDVQDWVLEQEKEMAVGIDDLQFQLKNFKVEKMRFSEHLFATREEPSMGAESSML